MKTLTCAIVGTGPLGLALAHRLVKSHVSVGLVGRDGPTSLEKVVDGEPFTVSLRDLRACHLVLCAVPAHAVREAFTSHAPTFTPGTPWINLSNGMVWDELAALAKGGGGVLPRAGVVQFGAKEVGAAIVTSGPTAVWWGPLTADAPTEAEGMLAGLEGWHWDAKVKERLVLKWIYNSVLNSLCALKGWRTNGEALQHWKLLEPFVAEAVALAKELWSTDFAVTQVDEGLKTLVQKTAANENSMARALRRGVKTEHDALLGWVHRASGSYPALLRLARDLESKLM